MYNNRLKFKHDCLRGQNNPKSKASKTQKFRRRIEISNSKLKRNTDKKD